ncbi:MAG: phenylalanine--tRNA ligase subunit beta [Campylobacterota bacterium]|nr:phenylalanine--tRNA ligase subunit beta [Campylobacterota bacterium]
MIVTKSWLNEWVDLVDIDTDTLCKTFNSIGLEVDRRHSYEIPKKIVIGYVKSCEKHPDADKLNICKVDIGTGVRQIVCGASNVKEGLHVAVATIGAIMPNGLEIKPVKLRGIDSEGMICSSTEINLPKLEDGIMILDDSIGNIELGQELSKNIYLNDDLIEIELTANRGDCLSIRGVARDLCAAFDKALKEVSLFEDEKRLGIGRILNLEHNDIDDTDLIYRAVEIKELKVPLKIELRVAQLERECKSPIEKLLHYCTHASGVILRAYPYESIQKLNENKALISVKKDENYYTSIYAPSKLSTVGVNQERALEESETNGVFILEASYIAPDVISKKMFLKKCKSDDLYYRTSRGSEPDINLGIQILLNSIEQNGDVNVYGGTFTVHCSRDEKNVTISLEDIESIIGMNINKTKVIHIFQNLGFNISKSQGEKFIISVPLFRHDIEHKQDIVEEIVRMVGIDNITSSPLQFSEKNRLNSDYNEYKKKRVYRHRSSTAGFNESIHFIFNSQESLEKYGFECIDESTKLLNPIVNTMDTLRPTLMLSLIEAASNNIKMGKKSVGLFEVGTVFNTHRAESTKIAFLFSGDEKLDDLSVNGKAKKITFDAFSKKISTIIGDIELLQSSTSHKLSHPYICADLQINGNTVGQMFKLHPSVAKDFDLEETMLCELDFDLLEYELKTAKEFSKFQASFRDLSLLVPKNINFIEIKKVITEASSSEVVRFYPADRYEDESLQNNISLTVRFVLQSLSKTLEEDDINRAMDSILSALNEKLNIGLR